MICFYIGSKTNHTFPQKYYIKILYLLIYIRQNRSWYVVGRCDDISPDGTRILIRRAHNEGAWMWARGLDESVEEAMTRSGSCNLDLEPETQGEAIAVEANGQGFYTTSEGTHEPIYYYRFI